MDIYNKIGNCEDYSSLSFQFRKKRFENFIRLLNVTKTDKIIDIGGSEQTWEGSGLEQNVTLLNLGFEKKNDKYKYIECNGCDMKMIADKSFDVAFSNSVIEHVGDLKLQKDFASEVVRISERHWVQTPYKYFPIEPHLLFPFFDLLPMRLKKVIALNWKYSHFKKLNLNTHDELSRLRLITIHEMQTIFPGSMIYKEALFGLVKSISAYQMSKAS